MRSIVCISSSDLKNWTDHGEVLRVPTNAGAGGMGSGGGPVAGSSGGPLGGGSGTTATPTGDADETGGCGCRMPGGSPEGTPSAWLVVAAALVATKRRRDRRVSTSVG